MILWYDKTKPVITDLIKHLDNQEEAKAISDKFVKVSQDYESLEKAVIDFDSETISVFKQVHLEKVKVKKCFTWRLVSTANQNTSLAAPGALAHHLQRRTACNTSPPDSIIPFMSWLYFSTLPSCGWSSLLGDHPGVSGRRGLERGIPIGFWALRPTFAK